MTDTEKAALERRIDELCQEVERLRKYTQTLESANLDVTARLQDYIGQYDPTDAFVAEVKAENAKLCKENKRLQADQAHWELGNCPNCPNVVSLQETLEQNAKLRELMSVMAYCNQFRRDCDGCRMNGEAGTITERAGCDALFDCLRDAGIEVPS